MELSEAKQLASILNGRKIGEETTDAIRISAKSAGLVIIFGASDDLAQIEGAINDEVSCCDGGAMLFRDGKLYSSDCDDESCPHEIRIQEDCKRIEILWCKEDPYCWTYKTNIPHEVFDIFEGDTKYCRGIIIDSKDLKWN